MLTDSYGDYSPATGGSAVKLTPLSLYQRTPAAGPRRTPGGGLVEHTLLGDPEEFAEMSALLSGSPDLVPVTSTQPAITGSSRAGKRHSRSPSRSSNGTGSGSRPTSAQGKSSFAFQHHQANPHLGPGNPFQPPHYGTLPGAASAKREEEERGSWLGKLEIFQRYRELRQERALDNWARHAVEWERMEAALGQQLKQDPKRLMMSRLGEFRTKLEERELLQATLALLESEKVDFWQHGIRMGSELLGLMTTRPTGGPRVLERILLPEAGNRATGRTAGGNGNTSTHPCPPTQLEKEALKRELREALAALDPFHGRERGEFLELLGVKLAPPAASPVGGVASSLPADKLPTTITMPGTGRLVGLTTLVIDPAAPARPAPAPPTQHPHSQQPAADPSTKTPPTNGVSLTLPVSRLSFDAEICQTAHSLVTLYNNGESSVHFTCRPKGPEDATAGSSSGTGSPTVTTTDTIGTNLPVKRDGVQRFFSPYTRGIIPPGGAFDIPISFKSNRPGIFHETWVVHTDPRLQRMRPGSADWECDVHIPLPPLELTLRGVALEPLRDLRELQALEHRLTHRQAVTSATRLMGELLARVDRHIEGFVPPRPPVRAEAVDEANFSRNNKEWSFTYLPEVWAEVKGLAAEALARGRTPGPWNGSVAYLYKVIEGNPDVATRSQHLLRLNALVSRLSNIARPAARARLYFVGYDAILGMAERLVALAEGTKGRLKLLPEVGEEGGAKAKGAPGAPAAAPAAAIVPGAPGNAGKPGAPAPAGGAGKPGAKPPAGAPAAAAVAGVGAAGTAGTAAATAAGAGAAAAAYAAANTTAPKAVAPERPRRASVAMREGHFGLPHDSAHALSHADEREQAMRKYKAILYATAILTLTPAAVEQLQRIGQGKVLKIGTEKKGCSGNVYSLKYIQPTEVKRFDEVVPVAPGVQVVVDARAVLSLVGSEMDWKEDLLAKGFTFSNPNIAEQCGCGLSFSTKASSS